MVGRRCLDMDRFPVQLTNPPEIMKWLTRLAIVAVFLMGALAGTAVGMRIQREQLERVARQPVPALTAATAATMSRELSLDPAQRDRLTRALETARPSLEAAEKARRERVVAVITDVAKELEPVLTIEQQERSRALMERIVRKSLPVSEAPARAAAAFTFP